ncbi:MAG: hypothetical protein OEZ58_15095 [Gammaproteobacteria bacterium]|nr:hypothetical protein [Gammaproteobacteria bacterium]
MHLNTEQILDMIEQPAAGELRPFRLHVATCPVCRQQLDRMQKSSQQVFAELRLLLGQESLGASQLQQLWAQIKPDLLKQQLDIRNMDTTTVKHSLSLILQQQAHLPESMAPETNEQQAKSKLKSKQAHWFASLLSFNTPLWANTVFASLLLVTVILVLRPTTPSSPIVVAQYQDSDSVRYQATMNPPAIGFFASANSREHPFGKVQVQTISENLLKFSWPALHDAKQYRLQLFLTDAGKDQLIAEESISQTHTVIRINKVFEKHYHWVLSGTNQADETFRVEGGFVLTR